MAYVTTSELRAHLGYRPEFVEDDVQIGLAADTASALLDDYCGRTFTVDTVATSRIYTAGRTVTITDVSNTATAVVAVSSDRLTWTTLDADSYYFDGSTGWPATTWQDLTNYPVGWLRVTALHGWTSVPDVVVTSTKLVASTLLSRRHSPNGVEASWETGAMRASRYLDGSAELLLRPYRRTDSFLGVA